MRLGLRNRDGKVVAYALVDDDFPYATRKWSLDGRGYVQGYVDGRRVTLHRVVMGCKVGDPPVDHIDGNPRNNQRSNLRLVTPAQNMQNRRPQGGSSQYRGVGWHTVGRKWEAFGKINRKKVYLGLFDDEETAAQVAAEWRRQNMTHTND